MESYLHWLFLCDLNYIYVSGKRRRCYEWKNTRNLSITIIGNGLFKRCRKDIEKAVEYFLQKNSLCLNEKEYEKIRDELFAVTSLTEETGFIKGFQYAVMLMNINAIQKNTYCKAFTIFKICSFVSLLQACNS